MTYQKKFTANFDPQQPYELHFDIPDPQKQALYQAVMTVITVLLGIGMTLIAQFVGQALQVPQGVPTPAVEAPAGDAMQALGTTHFENLAIEGDLAVGDDLTITDDVSVTGDTVLSGPLDVGAGITVDIGDANIGIPTVVTKAITYTAAAGGTGAVATIPDGQVWLIHCVLVNVTTNFDATGDDATLVVGDGNDADGFIVLADAELQAADTEGTGFEAGWQGMSAATLGAYLDLNHNSFVYLQSGAAETIDYLIDETTGETITAGAATIYVIYTRIQ